MFSVDYSISGNGFILKRTYMSYSTLEKLKNETIEVISKMLTVSKALNGEYMVKTVIFENCEYYSSDEQSIYFRNGKVMWHGEGR